MVNHREVLRLDALGFKKKEIATSMNCGRNSVGRVLKRAAEVGLTWEEARGMSEAAVTERLHGKDKSATQEESPYLMPDCEWISRELKKRSVTLKLLWGEYRNRAMDEGKLAYKQTQFNKIYAQYRVVNNVTMHQEHYPGDIMEVDWAGSPVYYQDPDTGVLVECALFVAVLPYSGYSYVEAMPCMLQQFWFQGHVNALAYFGGAPRMVVPDNLKASVLKNNKDEVVLNDAYTELAEHYSLAVVPARPRKPRDKPSVEGAVKNTGMLIIATLRNVTFFSLEELNMGLREGLEQFNSKPFQKREGSRTSVFEAEEKATLRPLPEVPYEYAEWRHAIVQMNYHISVDRMNYSVPFRYAKQEVDVRLTTEKVEIFCNGDQIASHARLRGRPNQYSTIFEHMPENHKAKATWTPERFRDWAGKIGPNTLEVISRMLNEADVVQQAFKGCTSVLKLPNGKNGSSERLEEACKRILFTSSRLNYRNIKAFYNNVGSDTDAVGGGRGGARASGGARAGGGTKTGKNDIQPNPGDFIRGADYYSGEGWK